jgi:hypothetical protein
MNIVYEFWSISNQMSPYLLMGFLLAGVMHVIISKQTIQRYLGSNSIKSVVYASLLGVPLPLCSCGVLPTGIAFRKQGASAGATVSFLISTPQTGVDSIIATYSLLGLPFAIARPIIAFISGIFGGIITNIFRETEKPKPMFTIDIPKTTCTDNCCCEQSKKQEQKIHPLIRILKYGFIDFIEDIGRWLLIGFVLATIVSVAIPQNFFTTLTTNPILHILFVLLLSVPLYTCATGSIPVAASLLLKGVSPGAALVFLMAGPATSVASVTVLLQSIGKRTTFLYLFSIIFSAVFFGLLIDFILPHNWFSITNTVGVVCEHHTFSVFESVCSVILFILIFYSILKKWNKYEM